MQNRHGIFIKETATNMPARTRHRQKRCAGALGIRLAGNASYFGKIVEKPYIGDATRAVEIEDIKRANRLLYATAILCEALCLIVLGIVGIV